MIHFFEKQHIPCYISSIGENKMQANKIVLFLNYFFLALPLLVVILHLARPVWFAGLKRKLIWGIAVSVLTWGIVCLEMILDPPETQFTLVCAGWLGWMYIWFLLTPVLLIYTGIRWGISSLVEFLRKKNGN